MSNDTSDIDMNQYLKAFSVADSKKKIDEVEMILNKKMGSNWKRVVFLMIVVIICIIMLIIYGINIDNNPYKDTLNHIKVFFIILLISISFFFVWVIIKPHTDNVQRGVVPFPPSDTLVPVDSTQCGIVPTLCTNPNDCKSSCKNKDGKSYYSCQEITHQNTYYLGTKLEVGKSYCLPNISQFNDISNCGSYTGRIVWAKNPDGTMSWQCQCLYPDLFTGSDCTKQIACKMDYVETGIPKSTFGSLVDSKNNKIIFSKDAPPGDAKTPYDLDTDGNPRFKCKCSFNDNNYSGFYTTNNDPFTCNQDLCASGVSTEDDAKFDQTSNKCVCQIPLYRSNISGFCYPVKDIDPYCNLNPNGDGCRYGVDIFYHDIDKNVSTPVIFLNNGRYYMADKRGDITNITNHYLLDITDIVTNDQKSSFIDISDTIFKDAFYSYPINIATPDYASDISQNLKTDMKGTLESIAKKALFSSSDTKSGLGLARKCNSYYTRWDNVDVECQNPLSVTGTEPIPGIPIDCGDGNPVVNISNYPWGYNCDCGLNSRKDPGCKVTNGSHMVKNDDGRGAYQVIGENVDRIVCNDIERAKQGLPPQVCVQKDKCVEDGKDLADGQDVSDCCFYEKDEKGNPIANFRVKDSWKVGYTTTNSNPSVRKGLYETCPIRERGKCSTDRDCLKVEGGQYGCSYMDKGNTNQICCPSSSYELIAGHGYWCDYLNSGDKCFGDDQCKSGKCNNGKESGKNQNDGGGTCA